MKCRKKQVNSAPAGKNYVELSEEGIETADPDWIQGYGYQMWRCRHNAFRADGARGQFIIVIPGGQCRCGDDCRHQGDAERTQSGLEIHITRA